MSERTALEQGYRRVLAWYPRSFRDQCGDEVLAPATRDLPHL